MFLLRFLRARKFDTPAAFQLLRNYYRMRFENPDLYQDLYPSSVKEIFDLQCLGFLRDPDAEGRKVFLLRMGKWSPDVCSLEAMYKPCTLAWELALEEADTQVNGIVALVDLDGGSLKHVASMSPAHAFKIVYCVQKLKAGTRRMDDDRRKADKPVVLPYLHKTSHNIKKVANRHGMLPDTPESHSHREPTAIFHSSLAILEAFGEEQIFPTAPPARKELRQPPRIPSSRDLAPRVRRPQLLHHNEKSGIQNAGRDYGYRLKTAARPRLAMAHSEEATGAPLPDLEHVARTELGETAETKEKCLSELRELIKADSSLDWPTDEKFLVKYLRVRKYNVKLAFEAINKYFRVRKNSPEFFKNLTPSNACYETAILENHLVMISKQRDPHGRAVAMMKLGAWNTDICSITDLIRAALVMAEWTLLDEETQIRGVAGVFDLKGLTLHHLAYLTPFLLRKLAYIVQVRQ
ncbi:hypothetical protein V5799_012591 [Amblyomma americanum]|uniref:CRAL/TRIO N-terminal domain-containing protein n=1 Tax=Amblyomma americanum TaxID=6943 RepID=A0AAQ4EDP5_AMBAM